MLVIREIEKTKEDLGFILYMVKKSKKIVCDDAGSRRKKAQDEEVVSVIVDNPTSRMVMFNDEYLGFYSISLSNNDLYGFFDGLINNTNPKYFYILKKYNVLDMVIKDIFNSLEVKSLIIHCPEWLYHRQNSKGELVRINDKLFKKPIVKLLNTFGFKDVGMIRDYVVKNGESKSVFLLQLSRGFFFKWQQIGKLYKQGFDLDVIAKKYKTRGTIINKVAKEKNWKVE